MNQILLKIAMIACGDMPDDVLVTAHNGIYGFGKITGMALKPFSQARLCDESGRLWNPKEVGMAVRYLLETRKVLT